MDNSNKAIAKRITKELEARDWSQTVLLRKIIEFKNPNISNLNLRFEINKRKGNFSTTLKGKDERSIPKEDLYIISKIFRVPLEYIWYGDEKKSDFIPSGARYAAFQDSESEYRAYIAGLAYEDRVQHSDEFGFCLFDYFGQYDSINGYKFFVKNYGLHFDYNQYGCLMYVNSEGFPQWCCIDDKKNHLVSDNLIRVLAKHNDTKTFREVFFDNSPLNRFNAERAYYRDKSLFSDDFLGILLNNEQFFELMLKTHEVDINIFNKSYTKGSKRCFVEPMLYEALNFALQHEEDFKEQLSRMLTFALEYSKSQYEFIKEYLKTNNDRYEHSDVYIDRHYPRFLRSSRYIPMGNVFVLRGALLDEKLNNLLKEIEQCTFNMTHIINEQERNDEEIKISTPNNPLFEELNRNAREKNISFVPLVVHTDKQFTYFQYYESTSINFDSPEHLQFIIDCLDKAQDLVAPKPNKVLVHGNLDNTMLMSVNGKVVGLVGWQKCYYGSKYEDRALLLSKINSYSYRDDYLKKYEELFNLISQGFDLEEKEKLLDRAIAILNEKRKSIAGKERDDLYRICDLKERSSKLELFKELYLTK